MPKKGQLKGTPRRRADLVVYLRTLGDGVEHEFWPWSNRRTNDGGYARVYIDGRKISAHRWVYEQLYGPLAIHPTRGAVGDDLVLHRCGLKVCIRPSHLYLGDARQNARDASERDELRKKLTNRQVDAIRNLRREGVTMTILSRAFGVSTAHISNIVHYKARVIGTRP